MVEEQKPVRVMSEGRFVDFEPRFHTQESFLEASAELVKFIEGFVQEYGIDVIIGFAAPMVENHQRAYQGALVFCQPNLAVIALDKLCQAVNHVVMMSNVNQQKKN